MKIHITLDLSLENLHTSRGWNEISEVLKKNTVKHNSVSNIIVIQK